MRFLSCESCTWEFMGNCWTAPPLSSDPTDDSKQGQRSSDAVPGPGKPPSPQRVVPSDVKPPSFDSLGDKKKQEVEQSARMRIFTYNDLKAATRNFRPDSRLGEGGFGSVFKGWIEENGTSAVKPGTGMVVAVKQLNIEGSQGHSEWLAEVKILGQLHHSNLVKLVGYCSENNQRLLVYEFMARGSLENHLFRRATSPLPWLVRMKIAFGAAKGLAFLHGGASRPVIYRDFKTSNILIDHDFTAKLSDFGLAKDGPIGDDTHVSTRIMGTYGYAAPEYILTGHLTTKNDVYGFGVVLLEMLTGRRCMDKTRPAGEQNLLGWARPYLPEKRKLFRLVDPRLEGQYSVKGLQKSALIAYQCTSRDPRQRPQMHEVVTLLEPLVAMKDVARPLPRSQMGGGSTNKSNRHGGANRPYL